MKALNTMKGGETLKKSSSKIRLLLLLFLVSCTLLNLNLKLSTFPGDCEDGGWPGNCAFFISWLCNDECQSRNSTCFKYYLYDIKCDAYCRTWWDYECEDGYKSYGESCDEPELYCPMK